MSLCENNVCDTDSCEQPSVLSGEILPFCLSVRMMDLIEKNLRLAPASRNFRADHIVCEVSYDMEVSADPLFWRFVSVVAPAMNEHGFSCSKQFSYYR